MKHYLVRLFESMCIEQSTFLLVRIELFQVCLACFLVALKLIFFSTKITIKNSNIPEIRVLVETSQSDEKLYFLKRISPEIPEIDHKLEAKLASITPRIFSLDFVSIFRHLFLLKFQIN